MSNIKRFFAVLPRREEAKPTRIDTKRLSRHTARDLGLEREWQRDREQPWQDYR
ncbi:hypothetical protein ACMA5I_14430 [Paracoccaceae bacterium GXU_MW_L88]